MATVSKLHLPAAKTWASSFSCKLIKGGTGAPQHCCNCEHDLLAAARHNIIARIRSCCFKGNKRCRLRGIPVLLSEVSFTVAKLANCLKGSGNCLKSPVLTSTTYD